MSRETQTIGLGAYEATIVLDAGPRILGFARAGGPQLFADLPDAVLESSAGDYHLIGGHRLWRAPEVPEITYEPDDVPVEVDELADGVLMAAQPDRYGMRKVIELWRWNAVAVVDHVLHNTGPTSVRCTPWAITQLAPGGTAFVPQPLDPADPHGVQPNRSVVFWPYTDPSVPEIELGTTEIRVHASDSHQPAKLGTANQRGWLAYRLGDELFVKWSPLHRNDADYADLGASVQCYRADRFLELETLGPLVDLEPGESVQHREVWTLIEVHDQDAEAVLASLPDEPPEMHA